MANATARRPSTQRRPSKPSAPAPAPRPAACSITSIHHPSRAIRNVVKDFQGFLSTFRYSPACAIDALDFYETHRNLRGCQALELVDVEACEAWLNRHLAPLLPPRAPAPRWTFAFDPTVETGYDPAVAPPCVDPSDEAWWASYLESIALPVTPKPSKPVSPPPAPRGFGEPLAWEVAIDDAETRLTSFVQSVVADVLATLDKRDDYRR
jgi:hypothetical protein